MCGIRMKLNTKDNHTQKMRVPYALTRLISFVMTGQTYIDEDTDPKLREFVEKGTNALPKQRFQSVDEMERTFSRIR